MGARSEVRDGGERSPPPYQWDSARRSAGLRQPAAGDLKEGKEPCPWTIAEPAAGDLREGKEPCPWTIAEPAAGDLREGRSPALDNSRAGCR